MLYCEDLSINKYFHLGITVPKEIICTLRLKPRWGNLLKTSTAKERLQVLYWLKQENTPTISAIACF
jgi:hypothetical protein